ncbi:MAG: DHA2 family efflux MFS transporter permease subunit [Verrucomicrobia bacterium]|nr:MAG: DHA2 family efflux MFS transporter permease subunit [Verrucomicrobiota bacterium]
MKAANFDLRQSPLAPADGSLPDLGDEADRSEGQSFFRSARVRRWIALWGAMLGAFMAVLDIQITNSSLPDILGSLGATLDEGSWISTSYLVAEIIVIPLTAWLADVFGTRRYLLVNTVLFLAFSVACAFAWNLGSMIAFRLLQGFTGGVLIPMAFTLVLKLLPPGEQPLGYGLFGMTATFAPAIGPTVGGWLTDNYGWPAIFYLNLIPGSLMLAAIGWGLVEEKMKLSLLRRGDWAGIGTMAVGLGSLIVFLEEGNRNDWFASRSITTLGLLAVISLTLCVVIELRSAEPFINLRLLARRNFGLGAVVSMAFGFAMYGATYLLPLYLSQVQGYNAEQIGWTIMWSGAPQLLMMPVAAALLKKFDARWLLTAGLAVFGVSCFMNAVMTHLTAYDQLKLSQLVRAIGMPLTIVPLTALATGGIEREQSGSASALFNMLRNLGGSIGIALLATQLDLREKFHSARLGESVSLFSPATQERMAALTQHFVSLGADSVAAGQQALAALAGTVRRESFVMAYGDCFLIIGVVMTAVMVFAWFCRPVKGAVGAAH